MDSFLNFIINYPFVSTLIYLVLGILVYILWCLFDGDSSDAFEILLIIAWPIMILAAIIAVWMYYTSMLIQFLFKPILKLGQKVRESRLGKD